MFRGGQVSKAKAKGTAAETAVATYLREQGWATAERRTLSGINDKGDIAGILQLAVEVKAQKQYSIPAWLKELAIEKRNAKAEHGVLIIKPNGVGSANVGKWWAVMTFEELVELLRKAGVK